MLTTAHFTKSMTKASGLKEACLERLRPIVVLAGANGGGKSRYLGLLGEVHGNAFTAKSLENKLQDAIAALDPPDKNEETNRRLQQKVESQREQLRSHRASMKSESDHSGGSVLSMSLAFNHTDIPIPSNQKPVEKDAHLKMLRTSGIDQIFRLQWIYCDAAAETIYDAEHPRNEGDHKLALEMAEVTRFNELLEALLHTRLETRRSSTARRPVAWLWGRPLNPNTLSHGQRVLLAWAIYLTVRWPSKDTMGAIVTLDEPESHLHPDALIEIVTRLRDLVVPNRGQLWIATHSPTLIAHLYGEASIFHVHSNGADFAESKMNELYCGLFGKEDTYRRAMDFMRDAEYMSFMRFAAECLGSALVASVSTDRQSNQLARVVSERLGNGKPLRVLDYASGKARFAAALAESSGGLAAQLDYYTWDDMAHDAPEDAEIRKANVRRLHPDADPGSRCSFSITDYHNEHQVDLVVACNFLHEVPVRDWHEHFQAIDRALKPEGVLLVMEDLEMPVGELPHVEGFIVLDLPSLRTLLGSTVGVVQHQTSDKRLEVIVVTHQALHAALADGAAFNARLLTALRDLHRSTLSKIEQLRQRRSEAQRTHSMGREHARNAMQLTNLTLAIRTLAPAPFDT